MSTEMNINGLVAEINTPKALQGDRLHALPPHCRCSAYQVDEYPSCPSNWMHGSSKSSSYFVPTEVGRGMWFDFTKNAHHKHHVAVVISVQGINPVTGQPITTLNMERYVDNCPKHNIPFKQDRYCDECKYKWPAQNYLATTTGLHLWLDGFRSENGEVRQYILTEEELRGVASQKIGDDRVWAIGFAFYLSKEPKPQQPIYATGYFGYSQNSLVYPKPSNYKCTCCSNSSYKETAKPRSIIRKASFSVSSMEVQCAATEDTYTHGSGLDMDMAREELELTGVDIPATKLEIGAGARIAQDIGIDPNQIDFWQPEPIGIIYVNYIDQKTANMILKAGKRQDKADGPLNGLCVGN